MKPRSLAVALAVLVALAAAWWAFRPSLVARPRVVSTVAVATSGSGPDRMVTMEIGGMVCSACVDKVSHELSRVPGVERVEVDLNRKRADLVCAASVADTALTAAVRRAGPEYLGLILER